MLEEGVSCLNLTFGTLTSLAHYSRVHAAAEAGSSGVHAAAEAGSSGVHAATEAESSGSRGNRVDPPGLTRLHPPGLTRLQRVFLQGSCGHREGSSGVHAGSRGFRLDPPGFTRLQGRVPPRFTRLRASEALAANSDDVAVCKLVGLLLVGALGFCCE